MGGHLGLGGHARRKTSFSGAGFPIRTDLNPGPHLTIYLPFESFGILCFLIEGFSLIPLRSCKGQLLLLQRHQDSSLRFCEAVYCICEQRLVTHVMLVLCSLKETTWNLGHSCAITEAWPSWP